MSKFLYSLIFLAFLFTSFFARANTFNQDTTYTISEIDGLLNHPSLDKKEKKEFKVKFDLFWTKTQLSTTKRDSILFICEKFRKKRARIVPDFYDYFNSLLLFEEKNLSEIDYFNWQKGLIHELSKPKARLRNINVFLKQTINLLQDNLLYKSFSTQWKSRSNHFQYIFDKTLKIIFDSTELVCYSQRDSCVIYNTSGIYFPFEEKWVGMKGKIGWTRAGKSLSEEYADFENYQLDITKSKITIDTVRYKNSQLLKDQIMGSLVEKVNIVKNPLSATYPKFSSFNQNITINKLCKNVKYIGGIEIQGAKFIGKGNLTQPAILEITRNNKLFAEASSEHFSFSEHKIIGKNTEITIHIDTFKIYHPNLELKILTKEEELILIRDGTGMSKTPYYNNYHNLYMDFGIMQWKMNEDVIHFKKMKGTSHQQANFESLNYFTHKNYSEIQNRDAKHPLVLLNTFANHMYSKTFTAEEYANYIKRPISQSRQQIIDLSLKGFVNYDMYTDEVTVKDRSSNYVLAAMGKQDYDVIHFTSNTEKHQDDAILNLKNLNLQINGVSQVSVSNSKNVTFIPKEGKLLVKQNRDFEFSGLIKAGSIHLYGHNFNFSYDDFDVNMELIDSLKAFIPMDDKGEFARINTIFLERIVKNTAANLKIDAPSNKSGIQRLDKYPIFNAFDQTYAYYNDSTIQNGVYKKDKFFISIDPFYVENINKLSQQHIKFEGLFNSGGILPNFREILIVNDDNSIGFKHAIEPNGVLAYNKATITDSLFLDNDGLWCKGSFVEKGTKLTSNQFILLPENAKGEAESYSLLAQSTPYSHPDVIGQKIWVEWNVNSGEYALENTEKNSVMSMYNGKASFNGKMNINNNKMLGAGEFIYANGSFLSNKLDYTEYKIATDTCLFKLLSNNEEGYTFKADKCKASLDLKTQRTEFRSTIKDNYSSFPANNYICQLNSFKWNIVNDQLQFGSEELEKLNQAWQTNKAKYLPKSSYTTFISTDPDQDSLEFRTPYAIYDTINYKIAAKFIENIKIADANIIPFDGKLTVKDDGYLETLNKCIILADTLNKYHKITDAMVEVKGKNNYTGSGSYVYRDKMKQEQAIYFDRIGVDTIGQTVANGELPAQRSFTLSPDFDFKGEVNLAAKDEHLHFDGETKIHTNCSSIHSKWLSFNAPINPKKVMIPIDTMGRNKQKTKLFHSLFITNDSVHIYPTFLSTRKFYTDIPLISVKGYLSYNKIRKCYQIGSVEKLKSRENIGELISYDVNKCDLSGEGFLNLGVDLGAIKTTLAGTVDYNTSRNRLVINACLGLDFFFSEPILKMINKQVESTVRIPSKLNNPHFTRIFPLLVSKPEADKIIAEVNKTDTYQALPSSINQTLFFNRVMLKWHNENKYYYSMGDLELGSILNTTHNNIIKGKIEIRKTRQDDRLYLYMEMQDGSWYYFEYQNKTMFMRSSIDKINSALEITKEKDRRLKNARGYVDYMYMLAPMSKVKLFKKRHQMDAGL